MSFVSRSVVTGFIVCILSVSGKAQQTSSREMVPSVSVTDTIAAIETRLEESAWADLFSGSSAELAQEWEGKKAESVLELELKMKRKWTNAWQFVGELDWEKDLADADSELEFTPGASMKYRGWSEKSWTAFVPEFGVNYATHKQATEPFLYAYLSPRLPSKVLTLEYEVELVRGLRQDDTKNSYWELGQGMALSYLASDKWSFSAVLEHGAEKEDQKARGDVVAFSQYVSYKPGKGWKIKMGHEKAANPSVADWSSDLVQVGMAQGSVLFVETSYKL